MVLIDDAEATLWMGFKWKTCEFWNGMGHMYQEDYCTHPHGQESGDFHLNLRFTLSGWGWVAFFLSLQPDVLLIGMDGYIYMDLTA